MSSLSLDRNPQRKRWITYVVLGFIFLILLITALLVFRSAKDSVVARQRAGDLQTAFSKAGLPVPSQEQIIRVLGDDGGAMCEDPGNALTQANLKAQMANGAAGPGTRPTTVDSRVVQGELLAIGIYCPDKLPEFTNFVNDLKFDDVQKN